MQLETINQKNQPIKHLDLFSAIALLCSVVITIYASINQLPKMLFIAIAVAAVAAVTKIIDSRWRRRNAEELTKELDQIQELSLGISGDAIKSESVIGQELNVSISKKIIKPENCVLAFGIPTSKEVFFNAQNHPNKDFAKKFKGIWAKYDLEIVSNIQKIDPILSELGATVVHNLTLDDFGNLFHNQKYDVIILFSHWKANAIEFHDGLAEIPAIINRIPTDFSGIIDLSVCHPEQLTIDLRKERPNCLVRFTNQDATPYLWLSFYRALLHHLKQHERTYLEALEEVIAAFLGKVKR
jgi:hypothetical protein